MMLIHALMCVTENTRANHSNVFSQSAINWRQSLSIDNQHPQGRPWLSATPQSALINTPTRGAEPSHDRIRGKPLGWFNRAVLYRIVYTLHIRNDTHTYICTIYIRGKGERERNSEKGRSPFTHDTYIKESVCATFIHKNLDLRGSLLAWSRL